MPSVADHSDQPDAEPTADRVAARRVGIVVLGMHRSGSSAITRMLSLLGCTLPQTLMGAASANTMGHWESDVVAHFNDEILALAGTDWHDWMPVNARLSETLIWPQLVARGRDVLRGEFADAPLFVLKDPRICKLSSFWLEVMAAEGIDAAFVLPLRNPIEVARSLAARDGIDEHQGLLIWLRHVLAAEAASRGRVRVFTEFAGLLDNWEELSVRLSADLGLVWPRISTLSGSEIAEFLTPELRHHVSNSVELGNNPGISPWIRKAYEVLLDWARQGEKPADYAVLDQISREFDSAGIAFARPMLNAGRAVERAAHAEAERATLAEARDAVARRLGDVEAQFAQACAERDARTAERDALADERALLGQERDQIAGRLSEVEAEATRTGIERDERIAERDELVASRAALAEERDTVARRLAEVEAELARAHAESDGRKAERDALAAQFAALADDRDKVAWRLGEVEAERERICGERDALALERDQVVGEQAGLAEERDRVSWFLGEAHSQLAQARLEKEQTEIRASGLRDDLAVARASIDTLQHRLAVTESTLLQREEEIAQTVVKLDATRGEATQHVAAAEQACIALAAAQAEAQRLGNALTAYDAARTDQTSRDLTEAHAARQVAEDRASEAEALKEILDRKLAERFAELAGLAKLLLESEALAKAANVDLSQTKAQLESRIREAAQLARFYRERELQTAKQRDQVDWLRQVHAVLEKTPRWWAIMPRNWRRSRESHLVQAHNLFDETAYFARYPDVADSLIGPLRHYILHGMAEGRTF